MAALPTLGDGQNNLLRKITENTCETAQSTSGIPLPQHNGYAITYYGATNNIKNIILKLDGIEVKRLTLTYVGGAISNDDRLSSID